MQMEPEGSQALHAAEEWLAVEWLAARLFQYCCVVWYFQNSCQAETTEYYDKKLLSCLTLTEPILKKNLT